MELMELATMSAEAEGAAAVAETAKASEAAAGASKWEKLMKMAKSEEAQAAKKFIESAMEAAAEEEFTLNRLEAYTSHTAASHRMIAELQQLRNSTMLGNGVYDVAGTMLKGGVAEGELVRDLREMADITRGDEKSMAALASAVAKVGDEGRLTGDTLGKMLEAGFDPLEVMSDQWEQFGFSVKKTHEELEQMMALKQISSSQVMKAMAVSTAPGGRYAGGLESVQGTSKGKEALLDAEIKQFKTTFGGWLLPIKDAITDLKTSAMHSVNDMITTSPQKKLINENEELLRRVNEAQYYLRQSDKLVLGDRVGKLKRDYPEYFSNADVHSDMSYWADMRKRIESDFSRKVIVENHKQKAAAVNETYNDFIAKGWSGPANQIYKQVTDLNKAVWQDNKVDEVNKLIRDANPLMRDADLRKKLWGKDADKNYTAYKAEMASYAKLTQQSGGVFNEAIYAHDFSKLDRLVHWQKDGGGAKVDMSGAETSAAIMGGGKKVISINLNHPVVGTQQFYVGSMKEAHEIGLNEFRESYLRVLQGAVANL